MYAESLQLMCYFVVEENAFHVRLGTRQERPFLPPLSNIVLEISASKIMPEKEMKKNRKEDVRLSLFSYK